MGGCQLDHRAGEQWVARRQAVSPRPLVWITRRTSRCDTTLRTSPKAMLRLVRQRWAIENQWHWPRDTQLGEDAHRYAQRNGVQVLALLRTLALNLLRCNGFRSIRAGLMAVAHDISRMLGWVGISLAETG
ncbi:transposase [Synechococcus sp. J7-Johnson]|uniref:transposase n=1 Tax=Synechococcus sp. J7-Johnson TaxID=2823737 RepID=UPI0028F4122E|nr:transposase [Synechococcus sp. J7-Johnson]